MAAAFSNGCVCLEAGLYVRSKALSFALLVAKYELPARGNHSVTHALRQGALRDAIAVEIVIAQPGLSDSSNLWPIRVQDRVPLSIPIFPFEYHVIMERAFVLETKPSGGGAGFLV